QDAQCIRTSAVIGDTTQQHCLVSSRGNRCGRRIVAQSVTENDARPPARDGGYLPRNERGGSTEGASRRASVGQTTTQRAQLTQSPGRGIHGSGPSISRHCVGLTWTHSPQLVQRVSSSSGSSEGVMTGSGPLQ